jgi:hypothetical protein
MKPNQVEPRGGIQKKSPTLHRPPQSNALRLRLTPRRSGLWRAV